MSRSTGRVLWLTGRPASGKTTLAEGIYGALRKRGVATLWLDSDRFRDVMTPQPDYSEAERDRVYKTLGYLAQIGAGGGSTVLISATASRARYRDEVRSVVEHFVEIFVQCDDQVLRERDPKGLYKRADAGELPQFPGVGVNYEAPSQPELTLDTSHAETQELVDHVLRWLDAYQPLEG